MKGEAGSKVWCAHLDLLLDTLHCELPPEAWSAGGVSTCVRCCEDARSMRDSQRYVRLGGCHRSQFGALKSGARGIKISVATRCPSRYTYTTVHIVLPRYSDIAKVPDDRRCVKDPGMVTYMYCRRVRVEGVL